MRVNLAGLLAQAANCIDPERDNAGYAFMLEEASCHVRDVQSGKHTLEEFAAAYCLELREQPAKVQA